MISQTVATKLAEKEATFAPRMLSLESELVDIKNFDSSQIVDALGYRPISADDVQDVIILGEGPIEKGWLFKPVTIVDERDE